MTSRYGAFSVLFRQSLNQSYVAPPPLTPTGTLVPYRTPNGGRRQVLLRAFGKYDPGLPQPLINQEVKPILDLIALLDIAPQSIVPFAEKTLVPLFGQPRAVRLVKAALSMRERETTKDMRERILEACANLRVPEDPVPRLNWDSV